MQITLAPFRVRPSPAEANADGLLATGGARVVLGGDADEDGLARSIVPGPSTLFGPRGACLAGASGPLFVCDTGHHRLLIWSRTPCSDHVPADLVIGQPDFTREGRNA